MAIVYTQYRGTSKYDEVYEKLKETARARSTITYGEVARIMGHPASPNMGANMGRIIGAISEDERNHRKPMLSALVVDSAGFVGQGFYTLAEQFGRLKPGATVQEKDEFWVKELKRVYATYRCRWIELKVAYDSSENLTLQERRVGTRMWNDLFVNDDPTSFYRAVARRIADYANQGIIVENYIDSSADA